MTNIRAITDVEDVESICWKLVIIWDDMCPLWCYSVDDAEVLNWDGFENAIGWRKETDND
jgi:hypothetical protein